MRKNDVKQEVVNISKKRKSSDNLDGLFFFAGGKLAENSDPDRKPYGLTSNNCGTFARDVIAEDEDVDNPSIWDPKPINIVDEYIEEGNAEVIYDPTINTTTIGKGDESDAKKHKKSDSGNTNGSGLSWYQIASLADTWLRINPDIQVTIQ